jgi:hypothetical protein
MKEDHVNSGRAGKIPAENEGAAEQKPAEVSGDPCRCKEVAQKTPRELLRLALNDLAFWKKRK